MKRTLHIVALIVSGEMIFGLPFHTARFFRPTLLDAFGFTNTQLGDLFAVYGVTAMLAYFPGGALADRFSARGLLTTSLVTTAIGGVYMASYPNAVQMAILYGYWGVTTIFLFWAALIRATREWGGNTSQGTAFGLLDGGRGLAAAMFAAFTVTVLAGYLPADATLSTDEERRAGFRTVILLYSAVTLGAAVLVWFIVPRPGQAVATRRNPLAGMAIVLRRPIIWAQAAVIICAYCGYKGLDTYSLYAVQVLGMDEIEGARLATAGAYIRPIAAVAAGLIADRFDAARTLRWSFAILMLAYSALAFALPETTGLIVIYVNLFISFFAVFALRGVYFALLGQTRTPPNITGAAVGMVSFVGYTPEIFFAPIAGRILDASPGAPGHLDYFRFLAIIAGIGIAVVSWLIWLNRPGKQGGWAEQEPVPGNNPPK